MARKEIKIICEKCKRVYSKGLLSAQDSIDYKENYAYGLCDNC